MRALLLLSVLLLVLLLGPGAEARQVEAISAEAGVAAGNAAPSDIETGIADSGVVRRCRRYVAIKILQICLCAMPQGKIGKRAH